MQFQVWNSRYLGWTVSRPVALQEAGTASLDLAPMHSESVLPFEFYLKAHQAEQGLWVMGP